jgi:probable rRNA maturation factor
MMHTTDNRLSVETVGKWPAAFGPKDAVRVARAAAELGGFEGVRRLSVSLVGEVRIRELNAAYRHKDKVTDVLSFRLSEDDSFPKGELFDEDLGDIFVCLAQVKRQAAAIDRPVETELALMVAHGTLHLLGYDHCTVDEEAVMFGLQQEALMRLGYL